MRFLIALSLAGCLWPAGVDDIPELAKVRDEALTTYINAMAAWAAKQPTADIPPIVDPRESEQAEAGAINGYNSARRHISDVNFTNMVNGSNGVARASAARYLEDAIGIYAECLAALPERLRPRTSAPTTDKTTKADKPTKPKMRVVMPDGTVIEQ